MAAALLVAAGPPLFPFDFFVSEVVAETGVRHLGSRLSGTFTPLDAIANVALFVPLGLAVANLAAQHQRRAAWAAALVAISTSLLVEAGQFFLPTRQPSWLDLVANTAGGIVGALLLPKVRASLTRFRDAAAATSGGITVAVVALVAAGTIALGTARVSDRLAAWFWSFESWDPAMALFLGSESDGSRPWHGRITEFCVTGGAASNTHLWEAIDRGRGCSALEPLRVWYILRGPAPFPDLTGQLPPLTWQGDTCGKERRGEAGVEPGCRLVLESPARPLLQRLRRSSAFTVALTFAPRETAQQGPARILSISDGPFRRNLTIAQWHNHLSLRVRTRVGRENGRNPELIAAHVVQDTGLRTLAMVFASDSVVVRVSRPLRGYSAPLGAAGGLIWLLAPPNGAMVHLGGWPLRLLPLLPAALAVVLIVSFVNLIRSGPGGRPRIPAR